MKFKEMYEFRDNLAKELDFDLKVYSNRKAIKDGVNPATYGTQKCCGFLKTQALLDAIKEGGYDAAFGGARRDEEKSRAKERIFSFRDKFGQWDPKNQRPELWNIYNAKHNKSESIRVFPISNWTELDIWTYIYREKIPIVPMYFAKERNMIVREGQLIPIDGSDDSEATTESKKVMCRYRTLGCFPCTGAVPSNAETLDEVIEEIMVARNSERITRVIDHDAEGSMELKKREGYF